MTMKKTALDFWVGLFVVLGFVALLFLALKAGNMSSLSFQATYPVKLKFDNIGGLKARAPVKSAGVTVGRVASIGFDSNAIRLSSRSTSTSNTRFRKTPRRRS
jgi:ABC-type transport system involved in resistance to organic solvents, periplasmic component